MVKRLAESARNQQALVQFLHSLRFFLIFIQLFAHYKLQAPVKTP